MSDDRGTTSSPKSLVQPNRAAVSAFVFPYQQYRRHGIRRPRQDARRRIAVHDLERARDHRRPSRCRCRPGGRHLTTSSRCRSVPARRTPRCGCSRGKVRACPPTRCLLSFRRLQRSGSAGNRRRLHHHLVFNDACPVRSDNFLFLLRLSMDSSVRPLLDHGRFPRAFPAPDHRRPHRGRPAEVRVRPARVIIQHAPVAADARARRIGFPTPAIGQQQDAGGLLAIVTGAFCNRSGGSRSPVSGTIAAPSPPIGASVLTTLASGWSIGS